MRLLAIFVLWLTSGLAQAQQEQPKTGRIGVGYIGGMEYWPFDDAIPGSPYPDRVLWSYSEGSEKAQACMLAANKKLVGWLSDANHPVSKALKEYKEIGGSPDFFMWTNDYTKAPEQAARGVRKNRVWWWSGSGSDTDGWLKFESTVMPDGTCKTPDEEQTVTYIESRYSIFAAAPATEIEDSNRSFFSTITEIFSSEESNSTTR